MEPQRHTTRTVFFLALLAFFLQACGAEDLIKGSGSGGSTKLTQALSSPGMTTGDGSAQLDDDSKSVTVSWVPPSQRQDGTPLDLYEVAEYRVHYGSAPGDYTATLVVTGGESSEATIDDLLDADRIYVAVEAVDTDGLASGPSDEVDVIVN